MGFAVSQFKSNIASNGGGARPSLFKVKISNSVDGSLSFADNEAILVKAAQIPGYGAYATAAGRYFEGEAVVTQVNKDGEDGQEYKISNIWPTNLGEIALGWETDAIEEYTVEWCYDSWASV